MDVVFACPPGSEVEAAARSSGLVQVVPLQLEPHRRRTNAAALFARLGAAARRSARETFSLDRTIASTHSLYQEILSR
ncbi:MAG: hypothetical protein ABI836_13495 [Gemmatimonadota bacterium]